MDVKFHSRTAVSQIPLDNHGMANIDTLKTEFDQEMRGILDREGAVGLCSTRFRQMIEEGDGYTATKRLLSKGEPPPNTFTWLRKTGRLDLSAEHYVVMEKYRPLFSDDEIAVSRWRLAYGD